MSQSHPSTRPSPTTADRFSLDDAFLRRLERLSLSLRRVSSAVGGRPGARRAPAADFIDHRPYSPGDDQRHIDWNAAARQDEVFVKVGRVLQSADVHLVLDISPSMAAWPAKRKLSLELAAALGWLSLAQGDRVTLHPFPAPAGLAPWQPARGKGRGSAYLRYLADLPAEGGAATALTPALRAAVRGASQGGLVVVISDLWLVDDLDAALALARPPRWDALVLHVLDRAELNPDIDGPVELIDAESGADHRLRVDDALRAQYRAALNARLERLLRLAGGRGATYALLPSDWPLEQAVIPYLQRRAVLAG